MRKVLPLVLREGKLVSLAGPHNGRRALLEFGDYEAHLSLYRGGQRETWVLTGFEKRK